VSDKTPKLLTLDVYGRFNKKICFNILLFVTLFATPFVIYWQYFSNDLLFISGDGVGYFANKIFLKNQILNGEFPLWNKYLSNGMLMAFERFYPFSLLSFLPIKLFVYTYYAIHIAIGGFFLYLYLKEIGCNKTVSVCTAFIYALSLHLGGVRLNHMVMIATMIYLPAIIYFIEKYTKAKDLKWLLFSSIFMALQFYSGFLQQVIYTNIIAFVYLISAAIYREISLKEIFKNGMIWGIAYIGLIALPLLPLIQLNLEYAPNSSKAPIGFFASYHVNYVLGLIRMIFPNLVSFIVTGESGSELFIGTAVFAILVFAVLFPKKSFHTIFALIICFIAYIFAANPSIPYLTNILYKIPVINGFRVPSRTLFIFYFFCFVLFAINMSKIEDKKFAHKLYKFLKLVVIMLTTALIAICIALPLSSNAPIKESLGSSFNKIAHVYLSTYIVSLVFFVTMKIYIYMEKKGGNIRQTSYVLLCMVITFTAVYQVSSYKFPTTVKVSHMYEIDDLTAQLRNDLGNKQIWNAANSYPEAHGSRYTRYNISLIYEISLLNAYVAMVEPRLVKLFSFSDYNPQLNYSGRFRVNDNILPIMLLKNDLLSMLGVKYIFDLNEIIGDFLENLDINDIKHYTGFIKGNYLGDTRIAPETILMLGNRSGKSKIFEIDYGISICGHARGDDIISKIDVYIDNILVSETPVVNCDRNKIIINTSNFPQLNHTKGYYEIAIITDGSFNPKRYGWSADDREFALDLFGIQTFNIDNEQGSYTFDPFLGNIYKLYELDPNYRIFENTLVADILYAPKYTKSIDSANDIYKNIFDYDLLNISYIEDYKDQDFSDVSIDIQVEYFKNNSIRAVITSDKPAFINFSQNWYPGWKTKVNGKKTKIYMVNGLIQGTEIPAGKNTVVFYYQPTIFIIGGVITLITAMLIVLLLIKNRKKIY
jgi:hypothetical protein